jgi:hypothetical protein
MNALKPSPSVGDKKTIFMVRHGNDLDFMLPILLFASNPIVFFWGVIEADDFRVQLLKKHNIHPIYLDGVFKSYKQRLLQKLSKWFGVSKKYQRSLANEQRRLMIMSLSEHLKAIDAASIDTVVFDHTVNQTVEDMMAVFRQWQKNTLSILSVPHGYGLIVNRMNRYVLTEPDDGVDWGIFDKLLAYSDYQSKQFVDVANDNKRVIPSLRDTKEWVEFLKEESFDTSDLALGQNEKVRFLVIHSLSSANVNEHELDRCFKILAKFDDFDVRIKPHPRRIQDAYRLEKTLDNVSILNRHIIEAIEWTDVVIFFHSSAVCDALLQNKPVIYPSYASSNKITDQVLKYCTVLETPDEFYELAKSISEGHRLSRPDYEATAWNETLDEWAKLLN